MANPKAPHTHLNVKIDGKDVTDKIDFDAAFKPHGKIQIKTGDTEIEAYIQSISHEMSSHDAAMTHIDWESVDGQYNGSASVPYFEYVAGTELILTADSMYKHYPHHPTDAPGYTAFGSPFKMFKSDPNWAKAEVQVDLSQIEADLAKLPAPTVGYAKGPSLSSMMLEPLSPVDHFEKYGAAAFANNEKFSKAASEQMSKYSEWFLKGQSHYIDAENVKIVLGSDPIGKAVDFKETQLGLEATVELKPGSTPYTYAFEPPFTVDSGDNIVVEWDSKGIATKAHIYKPKPKSELANAENVMKEALLEAAETLWVGMNGHPWPDKMNTLNGVHTIQLVDGTMLEVLLTVKPKEVKP